jgi:hypothetical protein
MLKEEGRRKKDVYIWGYRTSTQNEQPCGCWSINKTSEDKILFQPENSILG